MGRVAFLKLCTLLSAAAQSDGPGPAGPGTGLQDASGTPPARTGEEPTVGGSISGEQPNADRNAKEQESASPLQLPYPLPSRRVTRSASRTTQPSTAG